jgi:hypothetical protein
MEEELSGLVAAVTSLRVQLEQPPLARCSDLLKDARWSGDYLL